MSRTVPRKKPVVSKKPVELAAGHERALLRERVEHAVRALIDGDKGRAQLGHVDYVRLEGPTDEIIEANTGTSWFTARLRGDEVSVAIPVQVSWRVNRAGVLTLQNIRADASAYGLAL